MELQRTTMKDNGFEEDHTHLSEQPKDTEHNELTLTEALEIHTPFKMKLLKITEGEQQKNLNVGELSDPDCCPLGQWISGKGELNYGHLPEFHSVRKTHAELHACAGELVLEHLFNSEPRASSLLKAKFRKLSNKNQLELVKLFSVVKVR